MALRLQLTSGIFRRLKTTLAFYIRFSVYPFPLFFQLAQSRGMGVVIGSKGISGAPAPARSGRCAVLRKIFPHPAGVAYFPQKSCRELTPNLSRPPKTAPILRLRHGIKKVKGYEKQRKKNWNRQPSTSPSYIGLKIVPWLKFAVVALGFYVWGSGFLWVVLGLVPCCDILRGILSCLVSLVVLISDFSRPSTIFQTRIGFLDPRNPGFMDDALITVHSSLTGTYQ